MKANMQLLAQLQNLIAAGLPDPSQLATAAASPTKQQEQQD
jgi:hypothetical protein